jgi:cytochrome c-type biogenesis protein CcmH/NrfG
MSLVSFLLGLPLAPVRGFVALGRVIEQQVDQELYSPAAVRRQLEEIDRAAAAGELSPEEQKAAERRVLSRLTSRRGTPGPPREDEV